MDFAIHDCAVGQVLRIVGAIVATESTPSDCHVVRWSVVFFERIPRARLGRRVQLVARSSSAVHSFTIYCVLVHVIALDGACLEDLHILVCLLGYRRRGSCHPLISSSFLVAISAYKLLIDNRRMMLLAQG